MSTRSDWLGGSHKTQKCLSGCEITVKDLGKVSDEQGELAGFMTCQPKLCTRQMIFRYHSRNCAPLQHFYMYGQNIWWTVPLSGSLRTTKLYYITKLYGQVIQSKTVCLKRNSRIGLLFSFGWINAKLVCSTIFHSSCELGFIISCTCNMLKLLIYLCLVRNIHTAVTFSVLTITKPSHFTELRYLSCFSVV
jgi:hypothetical protein